MAALEELMQIAAKKKKTNIFALNDAEASTKMNSQAPKRDETMLMPGDPEHI